MMHYTLSEEDEKTYPLIVRFLSKSGNITANQIGISD